MNFSVERVRIGLLAGAGLLVVVIGAFLGYAHYRAHRFLTGLPGKLGIDIRQETNGVTYSQSVKGKTIYTLHAAKAIQRNDGKVTLDDVGIVLYGRGNGGSDRVDRIYGSEFEYDQNAGVVRAMGIVHIDLQAPAPIDANAKANYAAGHEAKGEVGHEAAHDAKDDRLIHVKTSGLVFLQKLGIAATDQDLEFESNGMTGHAHGAEYNSDTGLLILQSAVKMNGLKQGEPVVLTAGHAEMNRQTQKTILAHAVYTILGGPSGVRVAKGDTVTAYMRPGGSVDWATAQGNVSMTDGTGSTLTAARGEVHLNETNKPQAATFGGGVTYAADEPLRQARGEAAEGKASFSKAGLLEHVTLNGSVHIHERTRPSTAPQELWSERDLVSKDLELAMVSGPPVANNNKQTRVALRRAEASGDVKMTIVIPAATGSTSSTLSGDLLTADFVLRDGSSHIKTVHGTGNTRVIRINDKGARATSAGDTLDAEFQPSKPSNATTKRIAIDKADKSKPTGQGADEIATAVQQGHVLLTNLPVAKTGAATEERATADRAVYQGATEEMTLTGTVQVSNAGNVVWADRMVIQQQSGDAVADGNVRASYLQASQTPSTPKPTTHQAAEAIHILASRAELKHDAGLAFFYGGAQPARLWQGASQVTAPVLQFNQKERQLVAHGTAQDKGLIVHAVFVSTVSPGAAGSAKADNKPSPVRVASHEMIYSDLTRRADFNGGVLVENAEGTMRSQQGILYLQAADAATKKPTSPGAFMGGSVDRMIASGGVDIVQPGRRATGEQVVYTASDGMFVMTGLPGTPPRMMDEARGAITGASLRFHAGDNSVVVSNGSDGVAGQRVRSETRVKQ